MGLQFTHCKASWPYSSFSRFRHRLAEQAGFDLDTMRGYKGNTPWDEGEPLTFLLYHSDFDGILTPMQCARLVPRLRELMASWGDDDYDKQHGAELVRGMALAATRGECLTFC